VEIVAITRNVVRRANAVAVCFFVLVAVGVASVRASSQAVSGPVGVLKRLATVTDTTGSMAVGGDGSIYRSVRADDQLSSSLFRTNPDGTTVVVATFAGSMRHVAIDSNDRPVVFGPGSKINRIEQNGALTLIAGNGTFSSSGDGGPATSAGVALGAGSQTLAFGPDGSLYFYDVLSFSIRRITPTGTIERFAGTGIRASGPASADGVAALQNHWTVSTVFSSIQAAPFTSQPTT
jgi:streptogramin lyase